jgi:subfamily B ATP-binding cassette protein MsbA
MDSGNIVEQGTHEELLERQDGYYRNLYEVQFLQNEVV